MLLIMIKLRNIRHITGRYVVIVLNSIVTEPNFALVSVHKIYDKPDSQTKFNNIPTMSKRINNNSIYGDHVETMTSVLNLIHRLCLCSRK